MRPKRIDIWKLTYNGVTIQAPVFMDRSNGQFGTVVHNVKIWDTDLTRLRERAQQEFKSKLSIEWLPVIQVTVSNSIHHLRRKGWEGGTVALRKDSEAMLAVHVERYWIGSDQDGNKVHCEIRDGEEPGELGNHDGLPQLPYHALGDRGTQLMAFIPDTEENRAALERITLALETLSNQLRVILDSDVIEDTLAQITAGTPFLLLGPKNE